MSGDKYVRPSKRGARRAGNRDKTERVHPRSARKYNCIQRKGARRDSSDSVVEATGHDGRGNTLKTQSAKAKGRRLQQWVKKTILKHFKGLTPRDVQSTSMGAQGEDIKLSGRAAERFPYSVECKNQEASAAIYNWYNQAAKEARKWDAIEPLLVIKKNHAKPLVVLDAEFFILLASTHDYLLREFDLVGNYIDAQVEE